MLTLVALPSLRLTPNRQNDAHNRNDLFPSQASTNQTMVAKLQSEGILRSKELVEAFLKVDRGLFLQMHTSDVYQNSPIRMGMLHLSAPGIYAVALEGLALQQGNSFLNIGSGTGCKHMLQPPKQRGTLKCPSQQLCVPMHATHHLSPASRHRTLGAESQ